MKSLDEMTDEEFELERAELREQIGPVGRVISSMSTCLVAKAYEMALSNGAFHLEIMAEDDGYVEVIQFQSDGSGFKTLGTPLNPDIMLAAVWTAHEVVKKRDKGFKEMERPLQELRWLVGDIHPARSSLGIASIFAKAARDTPRLVEYDFAEGLQDREADIALWREHYERGEEELAREFA